jgi:endonuclease G
VFNSEFNQKTVDRTTPDPWAYDPKIPRQYQWAYPSSTVPTIGSPYQRGHLMASEDRVFSREANIETFYISNISPHLPEFHGTNAVWWHLEGLVRKWAKSCDTLYVVKGGAINPGIEILGRLPNRNNTVIPKYYYMALVQRKGDTFTGIAFWLEQRRGMELRWPNISDMVTIRELEEKTGINFFPNLKYALPGNPNLEEQVETTYDITKWPL